MLSSSNSSHDSETESDDSLSDSEYGDCEYNSTPVKQIDTNELRYQTPKKRKYQRSLHHGLSSKRANYHKVTPEKSAPLVLQSSENCDELNKAFCSMPSSHEYNSDSSSSSSSLSQSPVTSSYSSSDISGTIFDSDESAKSPFSEFIDSNSDTSEASFTGEDKSRRQPLFEGCKISEQTAYTMKMVFVQKHSLSKDAFSDLLLLISAHLPQSANFAKSPYKVKEILKSTIGFKEPVLHYICDICHRYCQDRNVCENEACRRTNNKMLEFHDLRLEDQLKDMFKDDVFYNTIKREIQLQKSRDGNKLYDMTDGTVYRQNLKSLQKNGDLYLTFTMNTDGVSLFSSSKKGSLWPVYIAINELPLKLRFSRKYLIPCYLHCHVVKPDMLAYLTPLVQILQRLHSHGIQVETCDGTVLVKAHLIASCLDLPARAMVSNMKQFNGKHPCNVCRDEGETPAGNTLHRYFPYQDSIMRTKDSFLNDAKEASRKGTVVNGIKGVSSLMFLKYIDQTSVFVADWMHGVLLGVTKALMRFWLDSKYRNETFFIGHQIKLLDERLLKIQIPDFISRKQRSLADHAHWKASECREWLIHFSTAVLDGILGPEPYLHFLLLVTAMSLLTKYGVSLEEVGYAETLLNAFCETFPAIYGIQSQTMNVHSLRHYVNFTRMYGPLYAYSCFGFESMNSYLKSMVHGTGHVNSQVCFAVGMSKQISSLVRDISDGADREIKQLVEQLSSKLIGKDIQELHQEDTCLGKSTKMQRTHKYYHLLTEDIQASCPLIFKRLRHKNTVFYCEEYQQARTKNSYTVLFTDLNKEERIGLVQCYILSNTKTYAVVKICPKENFSLRQEIKDSIENAVLNQFVDQPLCDHVWMKVHDNQLETVFVPTENIQYKCVFMDNFISCPPNLVEHG